MVGADSGTVTPLAEDDYSQLEKAKQRKTALTNALRQFNYKPKRGLKALIAEGFIPSNKPEDIARFLSQYGNPYRTIGSDVDSAVQLAMGSSGVPETFVIDGKGMIRHQHIGDIRPEDIPGILDQLRKAQ